MGEGHTCTLLYRTESELLSPARNAEIPTKAGVAIRNMWRWTQVISLDLRIRKGKEKTLSALVDGLNIKWVKGERRKRRVRSQVKRRKSVVGPRHFNFVRLKALRLIPLRGNGK